MAAAHYGVFVRFVNRNSFFLARVSVLTVAGNPAWALMVLQSGGDSEIRGQRFEVRRIWYFAEMKGHSSLFCPFWFHRRGLFGDGRNAAAEAGGTSLEPEPTGRSVLILGPDG